MHFWLYLLFHVSIHGLCAMEVTHALPIDHWFSWIPTTIHDSHYILISLNISSHEMLEIWIKNIICRNPSLWFATKARGLQGGGPNSRPGSHITCSRECKKCEGVKHSHSQMNSHVRSRVELESQRDSQNFRERFEGSNLNSLWRSLYQ